MLPQLLNDDNTHVICRALLQVLCRGRKEKRLFYSLTCFASKQSVSRSTCLSFIWLWANISMGIVHASCLPYQRGIHVCTLYSGWFQGSLQVKRSYLKPLNCLFLLLLVSKVQKWIIKTITGYCLLLYFNMLKQWHKVQQKF